MKTDLGNRIICEIKRPDPGIVQGFMDIPSSCAGDVMNRMYSMKGTIRSYAHGLHMAGTAITVNCPEGDNLMLRIAINLAVSGDVIVVNGGGCLTRSVAGEMLFRYALGKGIAGFVIDGSIRDVDSLDRLGFPVFAKGSTPQGALRNGPGEINVPICCGGIVVCPGDVIVADDDGVSVVSADHAEQVLLAAQKKLFSEKEKHIRYLHSDYRYNEEYQNAMNIIKEKEITLIK